MKFLLMTDSHCTDRTPTRRKDSVLETQLDKLNQIWEIFCKYKCDYLLHAGDVFNSADVSNFVISSMLKYFSRYNSEDGTSRVISIYGQHDISGHSEYTLKRSPLSILEAAGCINLLDSINYKYLTTDACIYGASFGCDIPKPEYKFNILMIHAAIGNNKFYDGVQYPNEVAGKLRGYNVIICGDFHYRFIEKCDDILFINPGCLYRKTIDKKDLEHRPAVVILDTETLDPEVVELKFKPASEVFDLSFTMASSNPLDESRLDSCISKLSNLESFTVDWKKILLGVYEELNTPVEVRKLLDKEIVEVQKG